MKHLKIDIPKIDLTKIDLHKIDLSKIDLHKIDFHKIDLHKAWELIKQYEHPSNETRNHIALLAGFQSWDELQQAFDEKEDSNEK